MATTHTPGPWNIVPLSAGQAIHAGPHNRICTLAHHMVHDGKPCGSIESQDKTQAEINANVRLIAAAPDLRVACVMALQVIEAQGVDWARRTERFDMSYDAALAFYNTKPDATRDALRAALTKVAFSAPQERFLR